VIAKAKLGQDFFMDLNKFKDEDELSVARIWRQVALSSVNQHDVMYGYQRAVQALVSNSRDTQHLKHELLLELANWMFENHMDREDCRCVIEWSIDVLLNMTTREDKCQQGKASKKSRKSSPMQKRSNNFLFQNKSRDSKSSKSSPKSNKTTPRSTKENVQIANEVDKRKMEKKSAKEAKNYIGISPKYDDICLADICNVKQLEGLIRSHVQLAILQSPSSPDHLTNLIIATTYVMRLWKILHEWVMKTKKNIRNSENEHGLNKREKQKNIKIDKLKERRSAGTAKSKTKRNTDDLLPSKTKDWCNFELTEEYILSLSHKENLNGLHNKNLTSPNITISSLLKLSSLLRISGCNHLALPVISLIGAVCYVHNLDNMLLLYRLTQIEVCYEVHDLQAAEFWENDLNKIPICLKDIALYRQNCVQSNVESKKSSEYLVQTWCRSARVFLNLGRIEQANLLIEECEVILKSEKQINILHCKSHLALYEGNCNTALHYIMQAQKSMKSISDWQDNLSLLSEAILLSRKPGKTDNAIILNILKTAINTIENCIKKYPNKVFEYNRCKYFLFSRKILYSLAYNTSDLYKSISHLQSIEDKLSSYIEAYTVAKTKHDMAEVMLKCLEHQKSKDQVETLLVFILDFLYKSVKEINEYSKQVSIGSGRESLNLPLFRQISQMKLLLVEVLLRAEKVFAYEYRLSETQEQLKSI